MATSAGGAAKAGTECAISAPPVVTAAAFRNWRLDVGFMGCSPGNGDGTLASRLECGKRLPIIYTARKSQCQGRGCDAPEWSCPDVLRSRVEVDHDEMRRRSRPCLGSV